MKPKVFIDGEAGTTGLQIQKRLEGRGDIALLSIDPARRKDASARAELLNSAELVILCLPDDAAREAVALITNPAVKVIDASTAHRVADGWIYGFPEMAPHYRDVIAKAKRVTNPGCWSTGAIALLRPLVAAGVLGPDYPVSINGVSGYSGGGKAMIAEFENTADPTFTKVPYRIYGLDLGHKHVPEIQKCTGLRVKPLMAPSVGRFAQGMLVEVPLHLALMSQGLKPSDLHAVLAKAYKNERFVEVVPLDKSAALKNLPPEDVNDTNKMRLFVFGKDGGEHARLVAQLDNLGKGASGQAVQNMNIMLGLPEETSLG
jgi:N-acetyl-gamma-glutamyl-phosphate reductase